MTRATHQTEAYAARISILWGLGVGVWLPHQHATLISIACLLVGTLLVLRFTLFPPSLTEDESNSTPPSIQAPPPSSCASVRG